MDSIMQQALEKMIEEVDELTEQLNKNPLIEEIKRKKKFINDFAKTYGGSTIYCDPGVDDTSIVPGQFKGWTLAKSVKWFLEKKGKDNPPSFDDIREALKQGDYDGKVSDIRIAIMKNNQIVMLKGGGIQRFGLMEWYGTKKKRLLKGEPSESEEVEIEDKSGISYATGNNVQENPN